jgi:hypothetical protein
MLQLHVKLGNVNKTTFFLPVAHHGGADCIGHVFIDSYTNFASAN